MSNQEEQITSDTPIIIPFEESTGNSNKSAAKDFHPVSGIFPLMSDAEYESLCADIKENGLKVSILTFNGLIIDGRNRQSACLEVGEPLSFEEWTGEAENLLSHVMSLNLKRRHLDEAQRAMVASNLPNMKRGNADAQRDAHTCASVSISEAAELFDVSPRSVQYANKVRRGAVDEIIHAVESGEMSLKQATNIAENVPLVKQARILLKKGKKKGKEQLVSLAQNLKVTSQMKNAKSTHDLCLLCNHDVEDSDENILAFFKAVMAKRVKLRRYLMDTVEEIQEMEVAVEMQDVYDRILLAIDAGHRTEVQIHTFVNKNAEQKIDRDTLREALELMLGVKIEIAPQGGKPDKARGARKQLYLRIEKKVPTAFAEAQDAGYIDGDESETYYIDESEAGGVDFPDDTDYIDEFDKDFAS